MQATETQEYVTVEAGKALPQSMMKLMAGFGEYIWQVCQMQENAFVNGWV